MECKNCGKGNAKIRHGSRSYGKGEISLVIKNIPVVSWPYSGKSNLTAETVHEIEQIKLHRKNFAEERIVAVATFTEFKL